MARPSSSCLRGAACSLRSICLRPVRHGSMRSLGSPLSPRSLGSSVLVNMFNAQPFLEDCALVPWEQRKSVRASASCSAAAVSATPDAYGLPRVPCMPGLSTDWSAQGGGPGDPTPLWAHEAGCVPRHRQASSDKVTGACESCGRALRLASKFLSWWSTYRDH